ncbi:hypothetical protein C8Q80DRAFT_801876 [Daedaleopsis nitida]|nr:hypothetical protein C8Q80DRAFT_801876 [Daedaleopsis nitida]
MASWHVSVLTSASSDTEATLLINFGTAKYIFNASEGMGRAWLQSHHPIRKTKGLFVTAAGTQRCGGVPASSRYSKLPEGYLLYLCERLFKRRRRLKAHHIPPYVPAGSSA